MDRPPMCEGAKTLNSRLLNKTRKLETMIDELKQRLREKKNFLEKMKLI